MRHLYMAAALWVMGAVPVLAADAAPAKPAPAKAAPGKSFDLVCSMTGFAGNDIMRPTKFERIYSLDFAKMKRCDRYKGRCGTVDAFAVQGGIAVLGDAPDSRGPDFFQSDYNLSTNVMMESLAVHGKIMSQTAGLCRRSALTPLDQDPPEEEEGGKTSNNGDNAG